MRSSYTGEFDFSKYLKTAETIDPILYIGHVTAVNGLEIESRGPRSVIGEMCAIRMPDSSETLAAEVVALDGTTVKLTAYGDTKGLEVGCEVVASGSVLRVPVGSSLLGRVIDATGKPCDGLGEIVPEMYYPAVASPPDPMKRLPVVRRVATGVRAIDAMLTVGKGQRLGIFAGSGVGKSTLISMIARNTDADINVIGLIGERGREVLDFINRDLGKEGLARSVVVMATSDQPSICRLRAAYVTTAVAEYFRVLKKGGVFAIHDLMSSARYGDMDAFIADLKAKGYEKVELIPTAKGMFMEKSEAVWMGLSGSALLVGRK